MKRLYVYILKTFFGPLIATFFVSLFVLLMQFLWLYIDDLVGKGLETSLVLEFVFQVVLSLLPRSVSLAVLLASLMAFGNMGERLELLSIKAAGVSLFKAMTPVIVIVVLISSSMLYFNHKVFPESFRKMRVLIYDIKRAKPELSFKDNVFNKDIPGLVVRIGNKNSKTGMLNDVMIIDGREGRERAVTRADSGLMETTGDKLYIILTLFSGNTSGNLSEGKNKKGAPNVPEPFRRDTFEKQVIMYQIDENFKRSNEDAAKNQYFSKNLIELSKSHDSIQRINTRKADLFYRGKIQKAYNRNIPENKTDLAIKTDYNSTINIDSAFLRLTYADQVRSVANSLASARRIHNDVMERVREEENILYLARRHLFELNNRIAISLLSIIMFFIGAPLGAIVRKGGLGLPVVLSVFFFVLYYIVDNFGRHLTVNGGYSPYFGAWLSTMVLLPIGVFLTRQATTDSVIMNIENYFVFFKKVFKKKVSNE